MARFVPFIVDTATQSPIGVAITRMKKADAALTEKKRFGRPVGCPIIFKIVSLKSIL